MKTMAMLLVVIAMDVGYRPDAGSGWDASIEGVVVTLARSLIRPVLGCR